MAFSSPDGNFESEWDYLVRPYLTPEDKKRTEETNKKLDQEILDMGQPLDGNGNPVPDAPTPPLNDKGSSLDGMQMAANITRLPIALTSANDNKNLQIPDDPYTWGLINKQWNDMVKKGKTPVLTIVPKEDK